LQAERKGVSASEYGLVFGIFELVSFLSCPILGKYVSSGNMASFRELAGHGLFARMD
jgi:hypothetical protein